MWTRRTGLFLSLHMLLKTWYSQEFYIINHLMAGFVTWEIGIRLTASTPCPNILVPKLEILLRHLLTPAGLLPCSSDLSERMNRWGPRLLHLGMAHSFLSAQSLLSTGCFSFPDAASNWLRSRNHTSVWEAPWPLLNSLWITAVMCLEIIAVVTFKTQEKYLLAFTVQSRAAT